MSGHHAVCIWSSSVILSLFEEWFSSARSLMSSPRSSPVSLSAADSKTAKTREGADQARKLQTIPLHCVIDTSCFVLMQASQSSTYMYVSCETVLVGIKLEVALMRCNLPT